MGKYIINVTVSIHVNNGDINDVIVRTFPCENLDAATSLAEKALKLYEKAFPYEEFKLYRDDDLILYYSPYDVDDFVRIIGVPTEAEEQEKILNEMFEDSLCTEVTK